MRIFDVHILKYYIQVTKLWPLHFSDLEPAPKVGTPTQNGVYADADEDDEDEITTPRKHMMPDGVQSPDSGIHGDKSATDLQA